MQKEKKDPDSMLRGEIHQVNPVVGEKEVRPLMVDRMLRDIKHGTYQHAVETIRRNFFEGKLDEAHAIESELPIMYPGVTTHEGHPELMEVNGLAVVNMRFMSLSDGAEALEHLRAWPFVKAYFHNVRGSLLVLVYLGLDFTSEADYFNQLNQLIELMNKALPRVHFSCRKRIARGFMASYDPQCFCRPDEEVETIINHME